MVADFTAGFVLFFFNSYFLATVILFGFFYLNSQYFIRAAALMFFSMVINAYLKQYWQIPLNPAIFKTGWAYPSGHTSSSVVFWGCITLLYRKKILYFFVPTLLSLGFISMVYVGYHDWADIFGGICLGLIIVVLSRYTISSRARIPTHILGLNLLVVGLTFLIAIIPDGLHKYNWLWMAQGMLLAISLASYLTSDFEKLHLKLNLAFLNFIIALAGIYGLSTILSTSNNLLSFVLGFITVFWSIYCTPLLVKFLVKKFKK